MLFAVNSRPSTTFHDTYHYLVNVGVQKVDAIF